MRKCGYGGDRSMAREYCPRASAALKEWRNRWKRGDAISDGGYLRVYRPKSPYAKRNGQILEHRLVMSEHIGRALAEHENVHHKNGDRRDNCLENLELWSTAQPSGQRIEDKVEFARSMMAQYMTTEDLVAWARQILAMYANGEWEEDAHPW